MENFSYSKQDDSILHRLKSALDHIWSVRKKSVNSPQRLEIQMSPSYILKDRAFDFNESLTVIPELREESPKRPSPVKDCQKLCTKIEFIRPKQRNSEESSTSFKSISSEKSLSPVNKFKPVEDSRTRKNEKSNSLRQELMIKAREELIKLKENKEKLQEKVKILTQSLIRIQDFKREQENWMSIDVKLSKLESQQILPETDPRLPQAISKVQHLDFEIKKLKQLKDSSILQYEQELKSINHKLKDLQECNSILTEILACFKKEPLLTEECGESEPLTPPLLLETVQLETLLEKKNPVLNSALVEQQQLLLAKQKLEDEYEALPSNSKTLSIKRRKLTLEQELSLNYSQLQKITSKVNLYSTK